jgi:hypothetical protein
MKLLVMSGFGSDLDLKNIAKKAAQKMASFVCVPFSFGFGALCGTALSRVQVLALHRERNLLHQRSLLTHQCGCQQCVLTLCSMQSCVSLSRALSRAERGRGTRLDRERDYEDVQQLVW